MSSHFSRGPDSARVSCWRGDGRTPGTAEAKQHKSMSPRHPSEESQHSRWVKPLRNTSARFGGAGRSGQRVKVKTVTVSIIQPVDLLQLGVGPRAPSCLCLFTGAGKSKMCLISEAVNVRLGMDQMSPIHPILPQQPLLTGYQSMYPPKQHCKQVV